MLEARKNIKSTEELIKYQALYSIHTNSQEVNQEAQEIVMRQMKEVYKQLPSYRTEVLGKTTKVLNNFKLTLVGKQDPGLAKKLRILVKNHQVVSNLANCNELSDMKNKIVSLRKLLPSAMVPSHERAHRKLSKLQFNLQIKKCARDMIQYRLDIRTVALPD